VKQILASGLKLQIINAFEVLLHFRTFFVRNFVLVNNQYSHVSRRGTLLRKSLSLVVEEEHD